MFADQTDSDYATIRELIDGDVGYPTRPNA
jgi:hypothetical protein